MRQKPRRSESARERRLELYVQATITISNHSRDGGYRGETEHDPRSSPTTPTAASRLTAGRGGRSSSTTYTTVTASTTITTNTNNTRSNNLTGPAVKWRLEDYEPGQPLFRHYREAPSSRSIQSGSIAPPSHTAAASLRRQFGYTPWVQDTDPGSATHSEQTLKPTHRPIVQLTGDQGPARASSVNSQH